MRSFFVKILVIFMPIFVSANLCEETVVRVQEKDPIERYLDLALKLEELQSSLESNRELDKIQGELAILEGQLESGRYDQNVKDRFKRIEAGFARFEKSQGISSGESIRSIKDLYKNTSNVVKANRLYETESGLQFAFSEEVVKQVFAKPSLKNMAHRFLDAISNGERSRGNGQGIASTHQEGMLEVRIGGSSGNARLLGRKEEGTGVYLIIKFIASHNRARDFQAAHQSVMDKVMNYE